MSKITANFAEYVYCERFGFIIVYYCYCLTCCNVVPVDNRPVEGRNVRNKINVARILLKEGLEMEKVCNVIVITYIR